MACRVPASSGPSSVCAASLDGGGARWAALLQGARAAGSHREDTRVLPFRWCWSPAGQAEAGVQTSPEPRGGLQSGPPWPTTRLCLSGCSSAWPWLTRREGPVEAFRHSAPEEGQAPLRYPWARAPPAPPAPPAASSSLLAESSLGGCLQSTVLSSGHGRPETLPLCHQQWLACPQGLCLLQASALLLGTVEPPTPDSELWSGRAGPVWPGPCCPQLLLQAV